MLFSNYYSFLQNITVWSLVYTTLNFLGRDQKSATAAKIKQIKMVEFYVQQVCGISWCCVRTVFFLCRIFLFKHPLKKMDARFVHQSLAFLPGWRLKSTTASCFRWVYGRICKQKASKRSSWICHVHHLMGVLLLAVHNSF